MEAATSYPRTWTLDNILVLTLWIQNEIHPLLYFSSIISGGFGVYLLGSGYFQLCGGSFNLSKCQHQQYLNNPVLFQIWGYVLNVKHMKCAITICGRHQWVIPPLEALLDPEITRKSPTRSLNMLFAILLFQIGFCMLCVAIPPGWFVIEVYGSFSV